MVVQVPMQVPSEFVILQSALLVQKTVFTHSDGSELGDCDGYEHTSMRVALAGRSVVVTQHCACVSFMRQAEPAHLFCLLGVRANGSETREFTMQLVVVIVRSVAPAQLNCFVSLHV